MIAKQGMRRLIWLTLFSCAMGALEAIVVVYLRELYYPDGFRFPVMLVPTRIAVIELIREAATLIMLCAAAMLGGRDSFDRFALFAYLFGTWDIVYYAALKAFLDWPASLFEWDLLFLIPVPWLAPVLYPVIVSCFLIALFCINELLTAGDGKLRLSVSEWLVASAGGLLVILSFCWNWRAVVEERVPVDFPVGLFTAGLMVGAAPFARAILRTIRR